MNQQDIETKVKDLLAKMTLAEKIGQMTQPEKNSVRPGDVAALALGGALVFRYRGAARCRAKRPSPRRTKTPPSPPRCPSAKK